MDQPESIGPRHITAGRPLPPRKAPPMAPAANDLPIRQAMTAAPVQPMAAAPALAIAAERQRPSTRPDPRPMRFAFGAGAMAAMSVMAVGFVKPDFGGSAEQPADLNAVEAHSAAQPGARVRRVTEYVFLAPGEKAPRGATVISPQEQPRADQATRRDAPAPAADRNVAKPAPNQPRPEPAAKPKVTTRQSGG